VLTLFAARLVQLQALEAGRYRVLALQQREKPIALPAMRGTITGANGEVLAMTVTTYLVYADPPLMPVAQQAQVATKLAAYLNMPADQILGLIQHPSSPQYVPLAKNVPAQTGDAIQAMNLPGIALTPTYARSYPDGDTTANIVGFTGTNQGTLIGAAGIEQEYNSLLAGRAGSEQVQIGTNGQQIPLAGSDNRQVVNGSDLRLTIVPALQYDAEQACAARVAKSKASNCTVVIIQPKTGYVLAMAQWPSYDPSTITNVGQAANIAVQNEFQPGSTAKVITAAAAFEQGGQTPTSAYTIPYQIDEGGQLIHDAEWAPGEKYTIAGIIAHSSNVGISQVAGHITPQVQYDYLRPRAAERPRAAGGDVRRTAPGLPVVAGHPVHAGVRPGRGGDRDPDGRGLRDDRQQRRASAADAGRGHDRPGGQVHARRAVAVQAGHPGQDRGRTAADPGAGARHRPGGRPALGHHPRLRDRGQDRHLTGIQRNLRPVRLRVELHWHGAWRRPPAGDRGERAEPAQGRLLRRRGGRPGLLPGDEGSAGRPADPAGRRDPCQDPPDRAVIGGTLTPWRSDPPVSSRSRCPLSARSWVSGWPR
jgi:hypothetical protein